MFIFTDAILKNRPIKVFNEGNLCRDFTYVDDIVEGIMATLEEDVPNGQLYALYNIGKGKPVKLLDFIEAIEACTGKKAHKEMLPMQPGDVEKTWADTTGLMEDFNYQPSTPLAEGVRKFVDWYRGYYGVDG
jgi:UDP-glucuronate 4-epimerase